MCVLRSCVRSDSTKIPLDMNFVLFGYCIGLWCIFTYVHCRQKRMTAHYKRFKDIAKSDEEMGLVKD